MANTLLHLNLHRTAGKEVLTGEAEVAHGAIVFGEEDATQQETAPQKSPSAAQGTHGHEASV
jgi:hypothetical protein